MGVAGRPRRQSRGAVLTLGDSAGPQRSSQAAGGASLWAPGLRTAGGGGPEGAERQRARPLCSLAGGVFSAQPRKPKPPSQWHPPESPFGTREAAPTHALAGGSGFPKGRTPHFPLLSMESHSMWPSVTGWSQRPGPRSSCVVTGVRISFLLKAEWHFNGRIRPGLALFFRGHRCFRLLAL